MMTVDRSLEDLRHALVEFTLLLEREANALTDIQPTALASVVEEKTHWADRANNAWQQLALSCRREMAPGESLDHCLTFEPRYGGTWLEIKELAAKADRLNQGNNVLIEAQLRRTKIAMDVLQTAASRGGVYGADGHMMDSFQANKTLDKA